jgi:hypothetical protein
MEQGHELFVGARSREGITQRFSIGTFSDGFSEALDILDDRESTGWLMPPLRYSRVDESLRVVAIHSTTCVSVQVNPQSNEYRLLLWSEFM